MANRMSVGDLAASVVAQDEGIRDELKGLVTDMIKHMRYTMRHGDPSQKTALSKQIIPQLLTAVNKVEGDEGEAEERAAYERMMKSIRGDVIEMEEAPLPAEATADAPTAIPAVSHATVMGKVVRQVTQAPQKKLRPR